MERLFEIFSNTADGAFIIDKDQRIIYWNKVAQEILGYTSNEIIGQPCYKILRGCDDKGQVVCHNQCNISTKALAGKTVNNYDLATCTKFGEIRWINISILTVFSPGNASEPLIVHLFRDATKTKQNEQFIHQMFDAIQQWQKTITPAARPVTNEPQAEKLTNREHQVLSLLAHGSSTSDIARTLSITPATTRNHIQSIFHKLNVHSRLEAVTYALEHGLVSEIKPKD
jgi:PAS domain S-box-containing protein